VVTRPAEALLSTPKKWLIVLMVIFYTLTFVEWFNFRLGETATSFRNVTDHLRAGNLELAGEVARLRQNLTVLEAVFTGTILQQEGALAQLRTEFQDMETQLERYFAWFEANANLAGEGQEDIRMVADACVTTRLELPCVAYKNEDVLGLGYLPDTSLGKYDFIQNFSFTLERGGGDCEDLATLFMSELRYMKATNPFMIFRTVRASLGQRYTIAGNQYLLDAEPVDLPGSRVYVVCYSAGEAGHCINAICRDALTEGIRQGNDATSLIEACSLVEPQQYGKLLWVIDYKGYRYIGDGYTWNPMAGWLVVISGNDLCGLTEQGWRCFSDYSDRIEIILGRE